MSRLVRCSIRVRQVAIGVLLCLGIAAMCTALLPRDAASAGGATSAATTARPAVVAPIGHRMDCPGDCTTGTSSMCTSSLALAPSVLLLLLVLRRQPYLDLSTRRLGRRGRRIVRGPPPWTVLSHVQLSVIRV